MGRYSSDSEDDRRSKRRRQRSKSRSRRSRSRSLSSRDSYSSSRSSRRKAKKSKKKQKKRSRSRSSDRDYRRRRSKSRSRTRRRSRSQSRSRRSYSRERRSRSGSYYRSRRRRSRSYRRSYSRSPGKSRSRRNSHSRSRSRRRSRSESKTRAVSKTEEIPPIRAAEDPCADIPGFHEMTPAEQNAVRMKMALKAAAETTARLREQGIFTGSAPGDVEKRQKAIADIEDEGFVQTNFKSSRSNPRVKEESAEDHHEAAMFGDVTSLATIPKAIVYKNTDSILAPIFYEDPDVKWDRWVEHVREYRRKKLEGEAMT